MVESWLCSFSLDASWGTVFGTSLPMASVLATAATTVMPV